MQNKIHAASTRRNFLKQSVMAAGMMGLINSCGDRFNHFKSTLNPDDIRKFGKGFSGRIIMPGQKEYETVRRTRLINPQMDKHPAIIAQCASDDDVLRCIEFAHQHQLQVAVRSGNHSALGWGSCENGIVIDLSALKSITVNQAKGTATVASGCSAEEILAAVSPFGLVPNLGQCGSVGAGLVLGGGLGYLSAKYGATCDTLLSSHLFTADGRKLTADNHTNPELFWGIRGGGGNFGIATNFEYQLYPLDKVLAGRLVYPIKNANALIKHFRAFMLAAPDELQGDFYYIKHGKESLEVEFVYAGNLSEGAQLIDKFKSFMKPMADWIRPRPYAEIYRMGPDNAPAEKDTPCRFHAVKQTYWSVFSDEAIAVVLDQVEQIPPSCHFSFNLSHFMHGQVCRVSPGATAFSLRKAGAIDIAVVIGWNEVKQGDRCLAWLNTMYDELSFFSGGRIYANYMSSNKRTDAKAIYGENYERTVRLKKNYDPGNFFRLNHNVSPGADR